MLLGNVQRSFLSEENLWVSWIVSEMIIQHSGLPPLNNIVYPNKKGLECQSTTECDVLVCMIEYRVTDNNLNTSNYHNSSDTS